MYLYEENKEMCEFPMLSRNYMLPNLLSVLGQHGVANAKLAGWVLAYNNIKITGNLAKRTSLPPPWSNISLKHL